MLPYNTSILAPAPFTTPVLTPPRTPPPTLRRKPKFSMPHPVPACDRYRLKREDFPRLLYRIQHKTSQTGFNLASGFYAITRVDENAFQDDDDFKRAMDEALDWDSTVDSPFVQLYTDEAVAHRLASCLTNTSVWTIDGQRLASSGAIAYRAGEVADKMGVTRKSKASRIGEVILVLKMVPTATRLGMAFPPARYGRYEEDGDDPSDDEVLYEAMNHI